MIVENCWSPPLAFFWLKKFLREQNPPSCLILAQKGGRGKHIANRILPPFKRWGLLIWASLLSARNGIVSFSWKVHERYLNTNLLSSTKLLSSMLNVSQIEFQILKWEPRSVSGTWDTREFVPQTLLMLKPLSLSPSSPPSFHSRGRMRGPESCI